MLGMVANRKSNQNRMLPIQSAKSKIGIRKTMYVQLSITPKHIENSILPH
jgi:hypothetical protein